MAEVVKSSNSLLTLASAFCGAPEGNDNEPWDVYPQLKTHNPTTISHLLNSKMRLMTQMLKHALWEGSDVTASTKTVSVQIKLDLRRPGTFNYPKYHQRRCHDLTSARINGVLTKSLTLRAYRARRLSVWMRAADSFRRHCLGLSYCTCRGYDDMTLKCKMT